MVGKRFAIQVVLMWTLACGSSAPDSVDDAAADVVPLAPVIGTDAAGDAIVGGTDSGPPPTDCNPVQPHVADANNIACPLDEGCGFNLPLQTTTSCGASGLGAQGDGCAAGDCLPGYDCIAINQQGRCARYCRIGTAFNDCGSQFACTAFLDPAYDGSQEVGICL